MGERVQKTGLALKHLGKQTNEPTLELDRVPWTGRGSTLVTLHCSEFTSHCPVTGQPDFGKLVITYEPEEWLVETKSLKLYLWGFRQTRAFNETLIAQICNDFFKQIEPRWVEVNGEFHPRGGISVQASVSKHMERIP